MIKMETFGYRGLFTFAQPAKIQSSKGDLFVIASPYGSRASLQQCLEDFANEFEGQMTDVDATTPYPKLTCFNQYENLIYTCTQFLNDIIYSNFNKNHIQLACDFICLYKVENTLYYTQIGWPLILLHRDKKNIPLAAEYASLPLDKKKSPFLPSYLLGVESSINFKVQSLNIDKKSEILIMKSNESPDALLSIYPCNLKDIANTYAQENPEQGFWLGKINF